jgi:hypothetical protein
VEEVVRGVTAAVLVTALFGLFTAIAAAVVAYSLGHKQTRNEKQAEVLIELRRKYLGLAKQLYIFSGPLPPDDELEQIESLQPDIDAMLGTFMTNACTWTPTSPRKPGGSVGASCNTSTTCEGPGEQMRAFRRCILLTVRSSVRPDRRWSSGGMKSFLSCLKISKRRSVSFAMFAGLCGPPYGNYSGWDKLAEPHPGDAQEGTEALVEGDGGKYGLRA